MRATLRGTPTLSIPASQNTAPVLEFRCLYTHDLRRKQKRWQDGFLRFHTFNKRIMVYDTSRNFIGDTHRKDNNELQEGDELNLDKGVLVEIADVVATTETDLTPLFEKRSPKKAAESRPISRPGILNGSRPPIPSTLARNPSQLRHKSLNTILATPKGPMGKASLPTKSPFETRQEKENSGQQEEERATKRQKTVSSSSSPLKAHGAAPVPNITSHDNLPLWTRTVDSRRVLAGNPTKGAAKVPEKEVIDLDSEPDHFPSDVTLPETPERPVQLQRTLMQNRLHPRAAPVSRAKETPQPRPAEKSAGAPVQPNKIAKQARPETPKPQQRLPRQARPTIFAKSKEKPPPLPPSSPHVSTTSPITNVEQTLSTNGKTSKSVGRIQPPSPPRDPRARALKLSSGRRAMLLCQAQPQPQPQPKVTEKPAKPPREQTAEVPPSLSPDWSFLEEEVVLSNSTGALRSKVPETELCAADLQQIVTIEDDTTRSDAPMPRELKRRQRSPSSSSSDAFEEMRVAHGRMDKRLLVSRKPEERSLPTTKANSKSKAKSKPPPAPKTEIRVSRKATGPKRARTTKATSPPAPESEVEEPGAKPQKPKARKSKSPPIPTPDIAPATEPPKKKRKTANLPILPQNPSTSNDPIQDDPIVIPANPSPQRGFRRVRSEGDPGQQPIPSSSTEWERSNLPQEIPPSLPKGGLSAIIKSSNERRKLQRSKSLVVETEVSRAMRRKSLMPPSPVVDKDVGPWSTEACDLFDWRPPGWKGDGDGLNEDEQGGNGMLLDG